MLLAPYPNRSSGTVESQHASVVLQRARTAWANFPNPNTHRFPVPAAFYRYPQPTALGTGYSATASPTSPKIDDGPASVPLPPTPPAKNSPQPLSSPSSHQPAFFAQPKSSRALISPSKSVPRSLPSSPRYQLPLDVGHLPPTLPPPSALFPLDPRSRYVAVREAPVPPAEVACPVNISPDTSALLQGRPSACTRPTRSLSQCASWSVGIIVLVGGLACLVSGVILVVNDAPYFDVGFAVMAVLGFFLACGSTSHLVWLSRREKKRRPQQGGDERRCREQRAVIRLNRSASIFSGTCREQDFADDQGVEAAEATELTLRCPVPVHAGEKLYGPLDHAVIEPSSIANFKTPSPDGIFCTGALVDQAEDQGTMDVPGHICRDQDLKSNATTSFLDLDDDDDPTDNEIDDSKPASVSRGNSNRATQTLENGARSVRQHQEVGQHSGERHQRYKPTPPNPAREKWRAAQRAKAERSTSDRNFNLRQSAPGQSVNPDQEPDDRMQDIVRYTSGFHRLRQDRLLQDQRYSYAEPGQGLAVHVPNLAIRARTDIAKAVGPAIERRAAARVERSKGKQKEEETTFEEGGESDGGKGSRCTKSWSHSISDADLCELASLAARSSGFQSVSSIAPMPVLTKPSPLDQGISSRRHLFGGSPNLVTPQTTTPSPISPTERGPGDLILRMRIAHKRSESAGQLRLARELVAGEGAEITLAPLLPATAYAPSIIHRGADGNARPLNIAALASRTDTGPAVAQDTLHAQDIERRDIEPAIQIQNASQLATTQSLPNLPDPCIATFGTAISCDSPSPPKVSAAAAGPKPPTEPAQPIAPAGRSSPIVFAPYESIGPLSVERLKRQSAEAGHKEKLAPLQPQNDEGQGGEEDEDRRASGFVDEGDESWGGGMAEEV